MRDLRFPSHTSALSSERGFGEEPRNYIFTKLYFHKTVEHKQAWLRESKAPVLTVVDANNRQDKRELPWAFRPRIR